MQQEEDKYGTSAGQVQDKLQTDDANIKRLVLVIGNQELFVKKMIKLINSSTHQLTNSSTQKLTNLKTHQLKNLNHYLLFYNTAPIFALFWRKYWLKSR